MMDCEIYAEDVRDIASEDLPWSRLEGMRVLVTGATGMVGSVLTDVLASRMEEAGFTLTAMSRGIESLESMFSRYSDRKGFSICAHDVNLPLDGVYDVVFHCASNTHPLQYSTDPIGTITTNVIGLRNLLEASSGKGRFVFCSSVEVYGQNRGDTDAFDESYCGYLDCNTVRAGYNESKRVGEALCQAYGSQKGIDFVIPRLSRLYGPSMRKGDTKAVSQFITKAACGEDIVLKSKGDQLFSYCYAADAVDAILNIFFKGESGNAYNVAGRDSDITLAELASVLAEAAGTKVVFDIPSETESRGYSKAKKATLDVSKVRGLGWTARHTMREGLIRTLSAFSSCRVRGSPRSGQCPRWS